MRFVVTTEVDECLNEMVSCQNMNRKLEFSILVVLKRVFFFCVGTMNLELSYAFLKIYYDLFFIGIVLQAGND